MNDKLHCRIPGGSGDYKAEVDKSNECDAIPTTCRQQWAATEFKKFTLGTHDAGGNVGEDGDNADTDEEEFKIL